MQRAATFAIKDREPSTYYVRGDLNFLHLENEEWLEFIITRIVMIRYVAQLCKITDISIKAYQYYVFHNIHIINLQKKGNFL